MSLDRKDIRCKLDPRTFAFLEAEARTRGLDKSVLMCEILDSWAEKRRQAFIEAHKILQRDGLIRAVEGMDRIGSGLEWAD